MLDHCNSNYLFERVVIQESEKCNGSNFWNDQRFHKILEHMQYVPFWKDGDARSPKNYKKVISWLMDEFLLL